LEDTREEQIKAPAGCRQRRRPEEIQDRAKSKWRRPIRRLGEGGPDASVVRKRGHWVVDLRSGHYALESLISGRWADLRAQGNLMALMTGDLDAQQVRELLGSRV
jgi:hypothetical protein